MLRPYPTLLLFILSAILLLSLSKPSLAAPTSLVGRSESSLYPRKGSSGKSVTITTSETQDSPNGPVIVNCVVTLTPITLANGDDAFEEVKKCQTIAAADTGASTGGSSSSSETATATETSTSAPPTETSTKAAETTTSSPATSTDSAGDSATTTSTEPPATTTGTVQPATTLVLTSESVTATDTPTPTPTSTSVKSTTTEPPAISVNGASTVASTAVPTAAPSPAPAVTTPTPSPSPSASASALPLTTSSSSAASTGTAAASEQGNGATSLPGKKLSVLPIGLGVFAGISVIALIVVGLVTYERTKYRKAFRQRKLAEAGAAMGYGGMNGMA